jgi:hypothetical protein
MQRIPLKYQTVKVFTTKVVAVVENWINAILCKTGLSDEVQSSVPYFTMLSVSRLYRRIKW